MTEAVQIVALGPRAACVEADARLSAEPALESAAWSIIEEDEARGRWRVDVFPADATEARAIATLLSGVKGLTVRRVRLADADWVALSLSGLPPVRAGRFFVYGAHDAGRVPSNAIGLRIDAGAAFGTGHHGTTEGCLLAYDRLRKARRFAKVLDIGAGTGLLAIAAALTGADRVTATDIDPIAVRIARANARLNRASLRAMRADGLAAGPVRRGAPYELVFANILARPLMRLAPDIAAALTPGGAAILSGLLRGQARAVRAAYLAQDMRMGFRINRDAWTTLVLFRRG